MVIGVSLACFYYWHNSCSLESQLKTINMLKKENIPLEAIEIHLSQDQMKEDYKIFKSIKEDFLITLHGKVDDFEKLGDYLQHMKSAQDFLGAVHIVFHAKNFQHFKIIPEGLNVVIENEDKRKRKFIKLSELNQFKQDLCVDLNHLQENNLDIKQELSLVKSDIKEFHISTIENKEYEKYDYIKTTHYLYTGSENQLPKLPETIFMIEGVIPRGNLDILRKEIEFISDTS